jgi:hypothetical protein
MNSNQLQSIVRLLLNTASGAILSWTASKSTAAQSLGQFLSQMVTGPDMLAVCMTFAAWLWGHVVHADPTGPADPPRPPGPRLTGPLMLLCFGVASTIVLSGCGTIDRVLLVPQVTPAITNAATGIVTPPATNYAVNPSLTAAIHAGETYAPLAPAPYGWIASAALALAAGGLGLYAKNRNGKLNDAQSALTAVVTGVEAAGDAAAPVKVSIQSAATAAGIQDQLDPLVQSITKQLL